MQSYRKGVPITSVFDGQSQIKGVITQGIFMLHKNYSE